MAKFLKRVLALVLLVGTLMSLAVPAAAVDSESSSVSSIPFDPPMNTFYIVKNRTAELKLTDAPISFTDCKLEASSLVKVTGSSGSYYKVDMNGTIRYVKKSAVQKFNACYNGKIYYTTKKAALRPLPYEGKTTATLSAGTFLCVVGTLVNSKGNTWFMVAYNGQIHYIYSGNVAHAKKVGISLSAASHSVDTRKTLQLNASVTPSAVRTVTWSSSNPKVATVNNKGLVTGVYAGTATITAAISGITYATWDVTVTRTVDLDVKVYRQTTNYTCSAASALAVLRYYGKETQTKDTSLYKSINGYVGKIEDALDKRLGNVYDWATFKNQTTYENAIYKSLAQGSPVIARVKFPKKYFNYSSDGHYTTICGIYKDSSGTTWLKLVDSFVDRYKSNSYANKDTGIVHVPLSELYKYGTYGGKSSIYLVYNP